MEQRRKNLRNIILASIFAALTAVSAFLRIPLPLASITLQVLIVLMAGLILPPLYAFASQAVYVLLGLVGLPVFTEGGGLAYALKPTFGFLIGFILAAWIVALLVKHVNVKKTLIMYFLFAIVGIVVIYLIGVPYGYMIFNRVLGASMTFKQVIGIFCTIYLPIDLLKAAIASFIAFEVNKRIRL